MMKNAFMRTLAIGTVALAASACNGRDATDEESEEVVGEAPAAINRFAMVCLKNQIDSAIQYSVRWGNGVLGNYSISPSDSRWHSWTYATPGDQHSPDFFIKFDSDLTTGESWVEYKLDRYAAEEESCAGGKTYAFQWDGASRRYFDLKSID